MISVTDLLSFYYCARKLYLQKVLKIKPKLKDSVIKGTIKHEVFEKFSEFEKNLIISIKPSESKEEVLTKYKENYSKILIESITKHKDDLKLLNLKPAFLFKSAIPIYVKESEVRSSSVHNLMESKKVSGQALLNNLPKHISEVYIESPELQLKGIIDKIEVYPDTYIPIEFKSGNVPDYGVWPGHQLQLISYIMLMQNKFDKPVTQGTVHYIDHDLKRSIAINEILKSEVLDIRDQTISILNAAELPDKTEDIRKCHKCEFKEKCYPSGI